MKSKTPTAEVIAFRAKVVAILKERRIMEIGELAQMFKMPSQMLSDRLRKCVEQKMIYRVHRGYYAIDPKAEPPPKFEKHDPTYVASLMHKFTRSGYELRKIRKQLSSLDACPTQYE